MSGGRGLHACRMTRIGRRPLLVLLPGLASGLSGACVQRRAAEETRASDGRQTPLARPPVARREVVLSDFRLGTRWQTFDPFLFCVHHLDQYPPANPEMGPDAPLDGRNLGSDFAGKDGWNMYHGDVVPGFPRHPHRGFETVTVTRRGLIDHSDSLGATARYGEGDVQWMTAGKGIAHAEMFPLIDQRGANPTELFQIWLNLPKRDKFADPHFTMFWKDSVPDVLVEDDDGKTSVVRVVAGSLLGHAGPKAPPSSYATHADAKVAIWSIRMPARARLVLPETPGDVDRTLYHFAGAELTLGGRAVASKTGLRLVRGLPVELQSGDSEIELLLLQGRPIGEPVAQRGPFVMNEERELREAFSEYRRTQFGGWPWPSSEPVHRREDGRFAVHADGREERAG